jgi:hypothetical protein
MSDCTLAAMDEINDNDNDNKITFQGEKRAMIHLEKIPIRSN